MKNTKRISVSLMALAWSGAAVAQSNTVSASQIENSATDQGEELIVTGSRVVSNGNAAPTPLTVLSTEKLLETTPSTIAEGLIRLPQFASSSPTRLFQTSGPIGAFLDLRRFGVNRNLVLLDGSRLPPTAASGAVDINIVPTGLVKRVDVVTGGVSAVYGSDAVTGVVNFVLDNKFNGLKGVAQVGTTKYGDNDNWKFNVVGGTDVLGGRGHIVGSFEHYDADGVNHQGFKKRPGIANDPTVVGAGTQANPFRLIPDGRVTSIVLGGRITSPTNVPALRDVYFPTNGVPAPFIHGTAYGSTESGGSGSIFDTSWLAAPLRSDSAFLRFDYDLTSDIKAYVQGSYNAAYSTYAVGVNYLFPGAAVFSGNPYIPASIQSIMTANNVPVIVLATITAPENYPQPQSEVWTKNRYIKTGLDGSAFDNRLHWNLNYGFSRSTQRSQRNGLLENQKIAAALDAVVDPATRNIVCAVSLTPNASQFPGCMPFNPFGPSASSRETFAWATGTPVATLTNDMHDVNLSLNGSPFSLWAGPVEVALNAEYRSLSLTNDSNTEPSFRPDCSSLRPSPNCTATKLRFVDGTSASMSAKQNVMEVGGEILVPLLRDQSFFKSLDLNLAGRYTDYSTSGVVYSWKAGLSWALNDDLRLRGTLSRDIRAPTLQDLFAPATVSIVAINDLHTGQTVSGVTQISSGNANLTPEIANTKTLGLIYQPGWLPRFSIAIDYYDIQLKNAITTSGPGLDFQRECEVSNGASPYCSALVRPLAFSDRSPANVPTGAFVRNLNAAKQWTRGVDVEINYMFDLADVASSIPGSLSIRTLASYQPVLKTKVGATIPSTNAAGIAGAAAVAGVSKLRVNLGLNYTVDRFSTAVSVRWQSKQQPTDRNVSVDLRDDIPAYAYTDISWSYRANVGGHEVTPFLTVENLFNKAPPIVGYLSSQPGTGFPTPTGFDVLGRAFTAGVKFKM